VSAGSALPFSSAAAQVPSASTCLEFQEKQNPAASLPSELESREWGQLNWLERLAVLEHANKDEANAAADCVVADETRRADRAERERQRIIAKSGEQLEAEAATLHRSLAATRAEKVPEPHEITTLYKAYCTHQRRESSRNGELCTLVWSLYTHPLFGEDAVEVYAQSQIEDRHGGQGGGHSGIRLLSEAEIRELKPVDVLAERFEHLSHGDPW
jgi:hypothetical protein